ncbi:hypothetical protein [Congregibacter sp.]|jgi:hypothetical protein|uniref:hypothetical protein n=1 Tax=Congregibacter sp. TaxID=2744308 RepID=UPI0039E6F115
MNKALVVVLLVFVVLLGAWIAQRHSFGIAQVWDAISADDDTSESLAKLPKGALPAEVLAVLDYDFLPEASGVAVSGLNPQRLWLINDSGGRSELVALDLDRQTFTRVNLLDTPNVDWEDLETFNYRGTPWVVVADVGDNKARRRDVSLYFLPEPTANERRVRVHSVITLSYPDGPRDVESLAVDSVTNTLYLLSKRERFPKLYAIALPELGEEQEYRLAPTLLGEVRSIPAPTEEDLKRSPKYGKHRSQPTGMSHVPDGSGIVLLTYGASYFAPLDAERSWLRALNDSLCAVSRPELKQAESIAADVERRIYITSEGKKAPVLRLTPGPECLVSVQSG